jgi:hypothetical protein
MCLFMRLEGTLRRSNCGTADRRRPQLHLILLDLRQQSEIWWLLKLAFCPGGHPMNPLITAIVDRCHKVSPFTPFAQEALLRWCFTTNLVSTPLGMQERRVGLSVCPSEPWRVVRVLVQGPPGFSIALDRFHSLRKAVIKEHSRRNTPFIYELL